MIKKIKVEEIRGRVGEETTTKSLKTLSEKINEIVDVVNELGKPVVIQGEPFRTTHEPFCECDICNINK